MFKQLIQTLKDAQRISEELTFYKDAGDTSTLVTYEDAVEANAKAGEAIAMLEKAEAHGLEFEYETFMPEDNPKSGHENFYAFQFKLMPCFEFDTADEMVKAREEIEALFPDYWKDGNDER